MVLEMAIKVSFPQNKHTRSMELDEAAGEGFLSGFVGPGEKCMVPAKVCKQTLGLSCLASKREAGKLVGDHF